MHKFINEIEKIIEERDLLYPLDVLFVGATGAGKSSTLNAIFASDVAKVGHGVTPETKNITGYELNKYLRLHDSAGLGDGYAADLNHQKNISAKLGQLCGGDISDCKFIDLCYVILDGSSRDLGTAVRLLESTILKCIEPERVCILINQADMAMSGRHWDNLNNCPNATLADFLEDQAASIKRRIYDSLKIKINAPVYYSAAKNYNLDKVMQSIVFHMPKSRRKVVF